jgi:hypothetical protein
LDFWFENKPSGNPDLEPYPEKGTTNHQKQCVQILFAALTNDLSHVHILKHC